MELSQLQYFVAVSQCGKVKNRSRNAQYQPIWYQYGDFSPRISMMLSKRQS